jgi:hypothetical protein
MESNLYICLVCNPFSSPLSELELSDEDFTVLIMSSGFCLLRAHYENIPPHRFFYLPDTVSEMFVVITMRNFVEGPKFRRSRLPSLGRIPEPAGTSKGWYLCTKLHGVTSKKNIILVNRKVSILRLHVASPRLPDSFDEVWLEFFVSNN